MLFKDTAFDLGLDRADITYYPDFLTVKEARHFYNKLFENTPWREDEIVVFGQKYKQPRLTALYAQNEKPYTYSNLTMHPLPFPESILKIKERLEGFTKNTFTTCLLNLYRDGNDSNGWHADDEKELGPSPIIASISLGATRVFKLRRKGETKTVRKIELHSGSLLMMQGDTQKYWQHQVPKTAKKVGPRINLTFRSIR